MDRSTSSAPSIATREIGPPGKRRGLEANSNRWKLAILVLAAVAQLSLPLLGFYSTSADESARAIGAADASVADLIRPDVWPPFYEVTVGMALHVDEDLVLIPRLVTFIAGLICLWALMTLTDRLFHDDRSTLIAGIIGALVPHRLIFSVAPMSEIFLFLFTILAATSLIAWIDTNEPRHGLATGGWILLATMVRYEAWAMAVIVAGYAGWRYLRRRDSYLLVVLAFCLGFPFVWLISNLTWPGDIRYLSITRQQAALSPPPFSQLLTKTALFQFAKDVVFIPGLLAGVATLVIKIRRDRRFRIWAGLALSSILLVSLAAVVTQSTPLAAPWRLSGTWTLLLIPFFAYAVTWIWDTMGGRRATAAATILLAITVLPMIGRTATKLGTTVLTTEELSIGREVGNLASQSDRLALIDSNEGYEYLDMMVAAGHPDDFVLTRGDDPFVLAIFSGDLEAWEERAPDLVANHAAPNYSFDDGVDPVSLACDGIGLFLAHTEELKTAAASTSGLALVIAGAGWQVYQVEVSCDKG
ncbi:MAG: glycosyltransferase family 39 protein [Acidimicrobiia bacterium]